MPSPEEGACAFCVAPTTGRAARFRRGVYLLPSLFTMGNMFCGYACVVYAMRGEYETAAPFIGFAIVLDMLDGRIARLTERGSEFGVEFDSLADVISFGIAPAILSFAWGLSPLGRLGWAAGFMFVACAAMRLARFNIQSARRRQAVFRRACRARPPRRSRPRRCIAYPWGFYDYRAALPALAMVLVPAVLMVSTIRFRSFKTLDLQSRRPYRVLMFIALAIMLVAWLHRYVLVVAGVHLSRIGVHRPGDHALQHRGGRLPQAVDAAPSGDASSRR